ncbi:Retinol dehydrogenase 13 [Halocaridina rubra]|uniref:Retinol dehydrogenase 13 n=1 Tax=Halocaridina rubra TaxID=373956 RepID=A0AAN8XRQ5_HALRR
MKKSAPARIINVTSVAHWACTTLALHDLNYQERAFPGWLRAYGQSKLCNILFTLELSEKLRGTGVTANSVHPGLVHTGLVWNDGWGVFDYVASFMLWFMVKDAQLGAQPSIYLAVSKDVEKVSGKYFVDCKETRTSSLGKNHVLARKLWSISEKTVKWQESDTHC